MNIQNSFSVLPSLTLWYKHMHMCTHTEKRNTYTYKERGIETEGKKRERERADILRLDRNTCGCARAWRKSINTLHVFLLTKTTVNKTDDRQWQRS